MLQNITDFHQVLDWVIANGYIFIFLVMCVEGPVITTAAGFACALGYFNPGIILILAILGDLIPDSIYYFFGYFGRIHLVEKFGKRFKLTEEKILKIENLLKKHFGKAMVTLKLTPFLSVPGFMIVGALKISFARYMKFCSAVTIPKVIIFIALGYFFGQYYNINQYIHDISVFLPITVIGAVLIYWGYKKISEIIVKKVDGI